MKPPLLAPPCSGTKPCLNHPIPPSGIGIIFLIFFSFFIDEYSDYTQVQHFLFLFFCISPVFIPTILFMSVFFRIFLICFKHANEVIVIQSASRGETEDFTAE